MPSTSMEVYCGGSGKGCDDGTGGGSQGQAWRCPGKAAPETSMSRQAWGGAGSGACRAGLLPGLLGASEPFREDDTLSGVEPIGGSGGSAKDMRTGQWNDGM